MPRLPRAAGRPREWTMDEALDGPRREPNWRLRLSAANLVLTAVVFARVWCSHELIP